MNLLHQLEPVEGVDEAKIAEKMRNIFLKQVLVRVKKMSSFPVEENFLAGYEFDIIRATTFRENRFGLRPIGGIGTNISCAFLHKNKNKLFCDKKEYWEIFISYGTIHDNMRPLGVHTGP